MDQQKANDSKPRGGMLVLVLACVTLWAGIPTAAWAGPVSGVYCPGKNCGYDACLKLNFEKRTVHLGNISFGRIETVAKGEWTSELVLMDGRVPFRIAEGRILLPPKVPSVSRYCVWEPERFDWTPLWVILGVVAAIPLFVVGMLFVDDWGHRIERKLGWKTRSGGMSGLDPDVHLPDTGSDLDGGGGDGAD